jgi:hypothetical protein
VAWLHAGFFAGPTVVHAALKILLEPAFEPDFLPCSFGFRTRRSAHDARQLIIDGSGERTPEQEVLFVSEPDRFNPIGVKGVGEVGLVGIAAAIANAVFHATGRRIRSLPITADQFLWQQVPAPKGQGRHVLAASVIALHQEQDS